MIAVVRPTRILGDETIAIDGDLSVGLTTSELQEIEAELVHLLVRDGELCRDDQFRLDCVERELNRRWGLSY